MVVGPGGFRWNPLRVAYVIALRALGDEPADVPAIYELWRADAVAAAGAA